MTDKILTLNHLIVFGNPTKPIVGCLKVVLDWAAAHGIAVALHRDAWDALPADDRLARQNDSTHAPALFDETGAAAQTENAGPGAMLVTLGGDGTMIHAIRIFRPFAIPVMGINLGSLGFNASVEADGVAAALDACLAGRAHCSERMLLEVRWMREGRALETAIAINDVVLAKKTKGRVVRLRVSQGGEVVTDYEADGLIVSTPTGSTAYNLSAGGPIVHPSMRAIIVSAICPHTLAGRAVVLPPEPPLQVESESRKDAEQATAWIDGREAWEAAPNDTIEIVASADSVRIVDNMETRYFTALRRKFNWSGELTGLAE